MSKQKNKISKREEILLEWYKTPFDEIDANAICGAPNTLVCYTEIAMIWAMERGAKMVGGHKEFLAIMKGKKEPGYEEEEEEDAAEKEFQRRWHSSDFLDHPMEKSQIVTLVESDEDLL